MKVFLTKRAERNFHLIKGYIVEKFGDNVAEAFEQKATDFLELLVHFPEMGRIEFAEKQIRGFQLTKNTRLFYKIKGERIIVLAFFDVRQSPAKLLF